MARFNRARFLRLGVTYALLCAWSLVCLLPLYWVAVTSLKAETDITGGPLYFPFIDFTPSLKAWEFILADPYDNLLARFFNSAIAGVTATLLTLLIGGLALYGLTRFRGNDVLFGTRTVMATMLATRILPPVAVVLPLYIMAQFTGTLDTHFALIFAYTGANLPVAIWLLRPVLGLKATEQEEAAQLDGASHAAIFFGILVPMTASGIAAAGLLIFILCWNEYLFAAYLAADRAMTLPPWLVGQMSIKEAQIGSEAEEWANFSAAAILIALPVLAFSGWTQRVVSGIGSSRK